MKSLDRNFSVAIKALLGDEFGEWMRQRLEPLMLKYSAFGECIGGGVADRVVIRLSNVTLIIIDCDHVEFMGLPTYKKLKNYRDADLLYADPNFVELFDEMLSVEMRHVPVDAQWKHRNLAVLMIVGFMIGGIVWQLMKKLV